MPRSIAGRTDTLVPITYRGGASLRSRDRSTGMRLETSFLPSLKDWPHRRTWTSSPTRMLSGPLPKPIDSPMGIYSIRHSRAKRPSSIHCPISGWPYTSICFSSSHLSDVPPFRERPLRPLLTSALRSGSLTAPSVPSRETRYRPPGVRPPAFIAHPPDLQP